MMHYNKEILSNVLREMETQKAEHAKMFAERRKKVYEEIPEVQQIEKKLSQTAASVLYAALQSGDDPTKAVQDLCTQNLALQAKRRQLLLEHGYSAEYLDEVPNCTMCSDTGYIGTTICDCLKKKYAKQLTEQLSTMLPIQNQNFEHFRFTYYSTTPDSRIGMSPRENMEDILSFCKEYANEFSKDSPNLLLYGSTGLGKTFLSSCIAKVVSEKGFSVAYDTAIQIFSSYESVKFNLVDSAEAATRIRKYEQCDLLIIDDLGTEMTTGFTTSTFYGLLAGRLMRRNPMIVNTNLLPVDLQERYSPAIASRLTGEFEPLRFFGDDIRQLRRSL